MSHDEHTSALLAAFAAVLKSEDLIRDAKQELNAHTARLKTAADAGEAQLAAAWADIAALMAETGEVEVTLPGAADRLPHRLGDPARGRQDRGRGRGAGRVGGGRAQAQEGRDRQAPQAAARPPEYGVAKLGQARSGRTVASVEGRQAGGEMNTTPINHAKARPILFSAPMIRALLDGSKTQTRRIVKNPWASTAKRVHSYRGGTEFDFILPDETGRIELCPYGHPGDLLWVRESIGEHSWAQGTGGRFAADGAVACEGWPWKRSILPSIHLPRGVSRITLELSGVRVERLRAISELDAYDEGIDQEGAAYLSAEHAKLGGVSGVAASVWAYADLWDSINGRGAWDKNPWVWCLTFAVHSRNVDDLLRERAA